MISKLFKKIFNKRNNRYQELIDLLDSGNKLHILKSEISSSIVNNGDILVIFSDMFLRNEQKERIKKNIQDVGIFSDIFIFDPGIRIAIINKTK